MKPSEMGLQPATPNRKSCTSNLLKMTLVLTYDFDMRTWVTFGG